jgi:mxaL protein
MSAAADPGPRLRTWHPARLWHVLRKSFATGSGMITAAFLLLLCALWLPQVSFPQKIYNYIVVFDITQSMNVEDYDLDGVPVSRLSFAREAARRALRALPCGSRVGWGAFAEYRTLLLVAPVEVCSNYNDLLASLERIDGRMRWANASEIRKGVYWAMRAANEVGKPDVVFLTDGQEAPPEVGPGLPLFDDLKRGELRGWLVGVGGYTPRRIPRTDDDGRMIGYWRADEVIQLDDVAAEDGSEAGTATTNSPGTASGPRRSASHEQLSELREPHLRALAEQVGFEYAHLTTLESLDATIRDARFARRRSAPADVGWIPALAALLMLAWRFRPWGRDG